MPVERQKPEFPASVYTHRAEVSFIERKHFRYRVASGQHHDRRVCETDLQIVVLLDHFLRTRNVGCIERLKLVCAAGDLIENSRLCVAANIAHQQIVELGQHEGRKQQRR